MTAKKLFRQYAPLYCEVSSYSLNGEIILKQNEINKMIDAVESDIDEVKNEIFRLVNIFSSKEEYLRRVFCGGLVLKQQRR